jgi:hypothetical protein
MLCRKHGRARETLRNLACQALEERDDLTDLLIGQCPSELDPPHDSHRFGQRAD